MAVAGLNGTIDAKFIQSFANRASRGSSSGASVAAAARGQGATSSSVSSGLKEGARNFAVGIQAISTTASFVNLARARLEQLGDLSKGMLALSKKVESDPQSSQNRTQLISKFQDLKSQFDDLVAEASYKGREYLTATGIQEAFLVSGLDGNNTPEVGKIMKAFSALSGSTSAETEENGALLTDKQESPLNIPDGEFIQALQAAAGIDLESGDTNQTASRLSKKLKSLSDRIANAKDTLESSIDVLQKNVDITRAAGFAFLDLSEQIFTDADAEKVAGLVRDQIRKNAPQALSQAANLKAITVASLVFETSDFVKG